MDWLLLYILENHALYSNVKNTKGVYKNATSGP
jgi:hypothetical protein